MAKKEKAPGGLSPELREKLKDVENKTEERTQIRRIKRLQELQDKLEHSHKIKSLKDIEKKVLYPQIVGIIILFPVILALRGGSLTPFYSPLVYPLLTVFIWILILSIEWFVFRMLEIKHHPSKSPKYIMAKNSIQRSITIIIVALIIFSLLYTPHMADEIEKRTSIEEQIEVEGVETTPPGQLVSKGRFGFQKAEDLTVHCKDGTVNLTLYEKEDIDRVLFEGVTLEGGESHSHTDFPNDNFHELVLKFNSTGSAEIEYEFDMKIREKSRSIFATVSFVYLAAFTEWAALLYPIRKKYSGVGIYQ